MSVATTVGSTATVIVRITVVKADAMGKNMVEHFITDEFKESRRAVYADIGGMFTLERVDVCHKGYG